MVMTFGGGVVSVVDEILVIFLLYKTYGVGLFSFRLNPDSG